MRVPSKPLGAWQAFSHGTRAHLARPHFVGYLAVRLNSTRTAAERHHLFPKAHLETLGLTAKRDTYQIANYALLTSPQRGQPPPSDQIETLGSALRACDLDQASLQSRKLAGLTPTSAVPRLPRPGPRGFPQKVKIPQLWA